MTYKAKLTMIFFGNERFLKGGVEGPLFGNNSQIILDFFLRSPLNWSGNSNILNFKVRFVHPYHTWLCVIRKYCFPVRLLLHPLPKLALLPPRLFQSTPVTSTFSLIQLLVQGDERIEGSKSGEDPTDNIAITS